MPSIKDAFRLVQIWFNAPVYHADELGRKGVAGLPGEARLDKFRKLYREHMYLEWSTWHSSIRDR